MKKKQKSLLALLVLLAVLAAALFLLLQYNRRTEQAQAEAEEAAVVHILTLEDADSIAYTDETGAPLELQLTDEVWQIADDPDFTIKQSVAQAMASLLSDFTAQRQLERQSDTDYGFDQPTLQVTVRQGDEEETLTWGSLNSVTGDYYLQRAGQEDVVYTVASGSVQTFQYTRAELYSGVTLLDVDADEVTGLTITKGGDRLAFEKVELPEDEESESVAPASEADEVASEWQYPDDPTATLDQSAVEAVLSAVAGQTTQWAFTNVQDPAQYGLDAESATAVQLTLADGSTETLLVGALSDYDGNRCVMRPDTNVVYTLSAQSTPELSANVDDYLQEQQDTQEQDEEEE